nr:LOW QUALITY PROTEIN: coiled-coil domain-containing protein 27 [Dasypus novemcinctus]
MPSKPRWSVRVASLEIWPPFLTFPQTYADMPKRGSTEPSSVAKGLTLLRKVASQGPRAPEWKLRGDQRSLSRSAQAISCYYEKRSEAKAAASPGDTGFVSQVEELRRAFLMRPGCPQFSTRATSMSQFGMATATAFPRDVGISAETWKRTGDPLSSPQGSDTSADGRLLPTSKSACELVSLRKGSQAGSVGPAASSPVGAQSAPGRRVPWYISIIHEKDHCLSVLGEEFRRLSELEAQSRAKDKEMVALREEREALAQQLRSLLRSRSVGRAFPLGVRERPLQVLPKPEEEEEEQRCWKQVHAGQMREESAPDGGGQEEADGEAAPERGQGLRAQGPVGETGALGEEKSVLEEDEEELEEEPEEERGGAVARRPYSVDRAFEDELIARLEECEQVIQEFQYELEVTRSRYSMATGTITSLQRQVDFQESQMQKLNTENENLQKELQERKSQLHAMTDKFSNIREDKKHAEMMGFIEKDNFLLRQQVLELESKLTRQDHVISEFNATVGQLQAQVSLGQNLLQRQKQLQEGLQSRNETIQQAEQQARVALESAQSRLERLRSKIIQATFSNTGVKNLSIEISDNDILESLQRVISERTDYYNQLRQKGVKVPPPTQSDASPPVRAKKPALK